MTSSDVKTRYEALNLRPLVGKTLVASNLELITVSSDVDYVFYFTLGLK